MYPSDADNAQLGRSVYTEEYRCVIVDKAVDFPSHCGIIDIGLTRQAKEEPEWQRVVVQNFPLSI